MNMRKIFCHTALSICLSTPLYAAATNLGGSRWHEPAWQPDDQLQALSLRSCLNGNLDSGNYLFGDYQRPNQGFFNTWRFSLAETSDVTISLNDFDPSLPGFNFGALSNNSSLFDNRYLSSSLFDEAGNLLGTVGEDGVLSLSGLQGNSWYTLAISGTSAGPLGGIYYGSVELAPVPIGDTLPLLGSALAVLAVVRRRKEKAATGTA